jgi:hypothetical protein
VLCALLLVCVSQTLQHTLQNKTTGLLLNATLVAQVLYYGNKGVAASTRGPATRAARAKKRA